MKLFKLAALASVFAFPAVAADIPAYAPPLEASIAGYDWSGFYVGAHVGYGWGRVHDINNPGALEQETDGVLGGLQAGYNWQSGNAVFGLEADISFSDVGEEWGGANPNDPYYGEDKHEFFGTLRGRVGYAFDRFLPYIHGGLAWAKNDHGFGCDRSRVAVTIGFCAAEDGSFYVEDDDFVVGFTVGAGAEFAVGDSWSIKAEYGYTDYGDNELRLVDPNIPDDDYRQDRNFDTHHHTIKVGANYRF